MPLSTQSRSPIGHGEAVMEQPVKHVILTLDNIARAVIDQRSGQESVLPFSRADEILSEYYTKGYTLKYVQNLGEPSYADGTKKALKLLYVLAK
jgi:hypothetical protein